MGGARRRGIQGGVRRAGAGTMRLSYHEAAIPDLSDPSSTTGCDDSRTLAAKLFPALDTVKTRLPGLR